MFCELVSSTATSAMLDPEDIREIVGSYHRGPADEIARKCSFVAKYISDGVLAFFGYPQAHEQARRTGRARHRRGDAETSHFGSPENLPCRPPPTESA